MGPNLYPDTFWKWILALVVETEEEVSYGGAELRNKDHSSGPQVAGFYQVHTPIVAIIYSVPTVCWEHVYSFNFFSINMINSKLKTTSALVR